MNEAPLASPALTPQLTLCGKYSIALTVSVLELDHHLQLVYHHQ